MHRAYQEVKKKERENKREEKRKEIEEEELRPPEGTYEVIVIDPPWRHEEAGHPWDSEQSGYDPRGKRGTTDYPTMSLEELKNFDLPAADDCVLWLWTTNTFMRRAFDVLDAWGFTPKTILTWDKVNAGVGFWLRNVTEHCILAVKGDARKIFDNKAHTTLIREKRGKHSEKPERFYELVEETCVGHKIDIFGRKNRDGWDVWGGEAG